MENWFAPQFQKYSDAYDIALELLKVVDEVYGFLPSRRDGTWCVSLLVNQFYSRNDVFCMKMDDVMTVPAEGVIFALPRAASHSHVAKCV